MNSRPPRAMQSQAGNNDERWQSSQLKHCPRCCKYDKSSKRDWWSVAWWADRRPLNASSRDWNLTEFFLRKEHKAARIEQTGPIHRATVVFPEELNLLASIDFVAWCKCSMVYRWEGYKMEEGEDEIRKVLEMSEYFTRKQSNIKWLIVSPSRYPQLK